MRLATLTAALLWSVPAAAADDDAQVWTTLGAGGAIGGRWVVSVEAIARFGRDEGGLYEGEIGGFLGYELRPGVSAWIGYVRVPRAGADEDRTRQQVTADLGPVAGGELSARIRMEQRFRGGGGTGWRLRPQLRFVRPLAKDGPELVLSHESFVGLNDTGWGQRAGYERTRNFAGVGLDVGGKVRAEIGYLNQYGFGARESDMVDHVASLALSHAF